MSPAEQQMVSSCSCAKRCTALAHLAGAAGALQWLERSGPSKELQTGFDVSRAPQSVAASSCSPATGTHPRSAARIDRQMEKQGDVFALGPLTARLGTCSLNLPGSLQAACHGSSLQVCHESHAEAEDRRVSHRSAGSCQRAACPRACRSAALARKWHASSLKRICPEPQSCLSTSACAAIWLLSSVRQTPAAGVGCQRRQWPALWHLPDRTAGHQARR